MFVSMRVIIFTFWKYSGNESGQTISYNAERIIGNGSFGVVFQATVEGSGEVVAIKKVNQSILTVTC